MAQAGLEGIPVPRKARTTVRVEGVRCAPDLVERDFNPDAPDRLWCADITYLSTWEGWLYLASVLDCFSRMIVGWCMLSHMRLELVERALRMAVRRRRPGPGLVHHSDGGRSQPPRPDRLRDLSVVRNTGHRHRRCGRRSPLRSHSPDQSRSSARGSYNNSRLRVNSWPRSSAQAVKLGDHRTSRDEARNQHDMSAAFHDSRKGSGHQHRSRRQFAGLSRHAILRDLLHYSHCR